MFSLPIYSHEFTCPIMFFSALIKILFFIERKRNLFPQKCSSSISLKSKVMFGHRPVIAVCPDKEDRDRSSQKKSKKEIIIEKKEPELRLHLNYYHAFFFFAFRSMKQSQSLNRHYSHHKSR